MLVSYTLYYFSNAFARFLVKRDILLYLFNIIAAVVF